MTQLSDYFAPETLFSRDNPFLKLAEKSHRLVFESLDRTSRLQLSFAEDLLDLNRERFDSLYACESVVDLAKAQQDYAWDLRARASRHASELQDLLIEAGSSAAEAAGDLGGEAQPAKGARKAA